MTKSIRSQIYNKDLEYFHEYGVYIPNRIIYFGSEFEDEGSECGVNWDTSKRFIKNITFLDRVSDEPITIYWNSAGGDWDKGMAIYDSILGSRSNTTVVCFGMVSSMGTIILQAADSRLLSNNCDFMMHDGSEWFGGEAKTAEAWAKYSKYTREVMYNIYLDRIREKHPRFKKEDIEKMCSHDYIISGKEAVELGLADKVLGIKE